MDTIAIEEKYTIPFFTKIPVAIERGDGVYVWDEKGRKYLDFTAGWGVTSIGHCHPVIIGALIQQGGKIMQNPSSGLTYSPARAGLLSLLAEILPVNLSRIFFANSGAEANDAVIKLARKVSGRLDVIAAHQSFHGRTISTASATGQAKHREKFNPLMPNYRFIPYNDAAALERILDDKVAAVLLEPVQGEGGVNVPEAGYLEEVSRMCAKNRTYLIIDEIQTGFCRTGPMFAINGLDIKVDFLTMAKGIAGGFPFGAFAVSEEVAEKIEKGDHGGTYCGNPLGCAVAHAVIKFLRDNRVEENVLEMGDYILSRLLGWQRQYPQTITSVRGKGLLLAMELCDQKQALAVNNQCLANGLFVNVTQGNIIRLFPALTITREEADEGLAILSEALDQAAKG